MIRLAIRGALLALAVGCSGAPGDPPAEHASPNAEEGERGAAAVGPGLEAAPSEALFHQIARGERSLDPLWDPERGIVYAALFEDATGQDPRAGPDGLVRVARHLCGPRAAELVSRLEGQLRSRARELGGVEIECSASACRQAALAEFDFDTIYGFERAGRRWILARVFQLEGGPVTDAFRRQSRAWADAQARRLAKERCR